MGGIAELAQKYLAEGVLPENKIEDALHAADDVPAVIALLCASLLILIAVPPVWVRTPGHPSFQAPKRLPSFARGLSRHC
jgi:hypothetical protein